MNRRCLAWFVTAALVAVSDAQAQKVEPESDSTARSFEPAVSVGPRLEISGVASPGVIGQLTVTPKPGRTWFSISLIAQMRHVPPHTRRDQVFLRRIAFGVGTDDGPNVFAFVGGGTGRIESPDSMRGKKYQLFSIGLGAGYTVGRMTVTVDLSHGESDRDYPPRFPVDIYTILGASLRWRLR